MTSERKGTKRPRPEDPEWSQLATEVADSVTAAKTSSMQGFEVLNASVNDKACRDANTGSFSTALDLITLRSEVSAATQLIAAMQNTTDPSVIKSLTAFIRERTPKAAKLTAKLNACNADVDRANEGLAVKAIAETLIDAILARPAKRARTGDA